MESTALAIAIMALIASISFSIFLLFAKIVFWIFNEDSEKDKKMTEKFVLCPSAAEKPERKIES